MAMFQPSKHSDSTSYGALALSNGGLPQVAYPLMGIAAAGLSYTRNKSIPLAIAHWFIGPIYLGYRGIQYAQKKM